MPAAIRHKASEKERHRYAYRIKKEEEEEEETEHCDTFFPYEPEDATGLISRRNHMLVNQYGRDLYVSPYTGQRFSSQAHFDGHMQRYEEAQAAQREQLQGLPEIPHNRMNPYEVYGDRKCLNLEALEIARLKQNAVKQKNLYKQERRNDIVQSDKERNERFNRVHRIKFYRQKKEKEMEAHEKAVERTIVAHKRAELVELTEEVHERLQVQDYRAIVWGAQKRKMMAEAAKEQAKELQEKKRKEAEEWKASAMKFQAFSQNKAAHEKRRADAISAEQKKEEMKDLKRQVRHIESMLRRKRDVKLQAIAAAEEDMKREAAERSLMQSEDDAVREYCRLLRVQAEKDTQRRRRQQRKKSVLHHHHAEAVTAADFRGGFEHVKQQRLQKQRISRLFAIVEHNHMVIRHVVTQARWYRWCYAVKMQKFKEIMNRWSHARIMAKRTRCWMWWKGLHVQYQNLQLMKVQKQICEREAQRRAYMNNFYQASAHANVSAVSTYRWPNQKQKQRGRNRSNPASSSIRKSGSLSSTFQRSLMGSQSTPGFSV